MNGLGQVWLGWGTRRVLRLVSGVAKINMGHDEGIEGRADRRGLYIVRLLTLLY
jgi:hypothetical protein